MRPVDALILLDTHIILQLESWTQEDIADKLGISTHAYAKIERGETDVNLSRLQQIAEVMEIGLSQLFIWFG